MTNMASWFCNITRIAVAAIEMKNSRSHSGRIDEVVVEDFR